MNQTTGRRQPDDIKELFEFEYQGTKYKIFLFFTESGARQEIARVRHPVAQWAPIYADNENNGNAALIRYTLRSCSRGDSPIPLCSCKDYLQSSAVFRVKNVVAYVDFEHTEPQSDGLTKAARHLAELLVTSAHASSAATP